MNRNKMPCPRQKAGQEQAQERKRETRRKAAMERFLEREQDRALFELSPRPARSLILFFCKLYPLYYEHALG